MSEAITVENVNVAQVMSAEGAVERVQRILAGLEENPAVKKLMEAAETVEDMYAVAKEYIQIKLEDFKVLWDKTVDYFKESKAALPDEVMDSVVGGWSISGFFNKWKKEIIATTIAVGCTVAGIAIGAVLGGWVGAAAGAVAGAAVGLTFATMYYEDK